MTLAVFAHLDFNLLSPSHSLFSSLTHMNNLGGYAYGYNHALQLISTATIIAVATAMATAMAIAMATVMATAMAMVTALDTVIAMAKVTVTDRDN